jgi:hypothetical protein
MSQAKSLVLPNLKVPSLISGICDQKLEVDGFRPICLAEIYRFGLSLQGKLRSSNSRHVIVICAGQHKDSITNTALAVGGFLILFKGLSCAEVSQIFSELLGICVEYTESSSSGPNSEGFSLLDSWSALSIARSLFFFLAAIQNSQKAGQC